MTGTFKTKTRVYTSPEFFTPITGRKSFIDAAVDFRRGLIENSSMAVLNADLAVKAAMGAGLSSSSASVGQTSQGGSPDSDGKKRVNRGGVPGMDEDEEGYRYMPEATWGPGKVLKLFPSKEERQSSNKVPNFGFVDEEVMLTPEQFVQQMKQKPKIRLSKYKINTRTGEPIEDTEVEFDRMRFGKTFDLNPDTSDEIDENISEDTSEEMQEKSLGSSLKQRMPGGSLIGRAAARFGVIMDELGKMRCPPGTPAANQFTDMTGSNCFGTTPGNIISEAIDLAQRLVPENDPMRSGGFTRGIANFLFDMENGIFGNNVWYHADGTRMKHGEWRKFRAAGGVAKNERWMENGVERVRAELDAQDARMADLYAKLGVDVSDASKETNEHLYETFKKLRESGVITTEIFGKPSPAQVEAMMIARLENMDAHWIARTDDEKKTLLKIEVMRYRELERAHLEAFLDEVIKNPEHMKTVTQIRFNPTGYDRASFGLLSGKSADGKLQGSIDIDIPNTMAFQDSMLPNLSSDERLRIWAEGGQSDALRALAVKDFLVNSNSHAGQMMAMVDGGRGLGRHDMKHEIAHSIQAAAIFEHMKRELDARGSLLISRGPDKPPIVITSIDQLTSGHVMSLMAKENFMGIDLEALNNLRSRADVVAFLAGRYIWDVVDKSYGGERRASEIGAELWALRSAGLIFGPDVDAALEYMDDAADGAITIDRVVSDSVLVNRIYEDHLDGSTRVREAREARERAAAEAGSADGEFFDADERAAEARMSAAREAYAKEKRAQIKAAKEAAKTMSEEEMIDFLAESTEASDVLNEMLDAADDAGEEPSWMRVMDRDTIDSLTKVVADEWVKRFTVRRSPEAMEKLQNMIDKKRESRGSLSPDKIEERRYREFMEGSTERAKDMDLAELVQHYSDWEELATGEGVDGPERARRKQMRDMYRDEYVKRRTEGPDSVSKEDARKEFNSKFKEIRKPKTAAERKKQDRAKPKKFTSHKGKNGAHTFATEERARLLEGATTAEKIAFVEMGAGETDVINMMIGHDEGIAAARAIQRRNTRLKKNGILPDALNQHEASIEEQIENFYIPLVELMDKSSLSQTVEMYIDSDDNAVIAVEDLLNGGMPVGSEGIGTGTLVTDKTDFSDGKKIIIRVPEGSRALLPDWSYSSDSDNGEQKILLPPSKLHLVEIREDGTVVLEVGEQKGTEAILREAVEQIGATAGDSDVAYRQGLQKKVSRVVDARIAERRKQGMFDPSKSSPIEEERFSATADTAASGAGFIPDGPPPAPSKIDTDGKPKAQRGLKRRQSSTAMSWIINADSWKQPSQAQDALDEIHGYITGEGAFQGRTNSTGIQVRGIMQRAFGTQNISELTEEQKYDLIDLISERMTKAPKDQQRGLSQAKSKIQDHVDISKMVKSNNYSDPYVTSDFDFADMDFTPVTPIRGGGEDRLSSGAKWGQMPSSNGQIARLLEPSNNDGFNEIFGPPQTREERVTQMAELQSEVMTSLREMFDNVPGAGDSIGLDVTHVDPVLADFIKNSSDEEIYKLVAESAKNLHESFDARPRVRMRQDELDRFAASGRYGREGSFNTERLSSGMVKKGIRARAKERAIEIISERIGKDEDSKEIAEMFLNTVSALKFGPEAALARLAVDLGRRGSRDLAERTVQELLDRGKITDEQAKSILSKLDKIAPDGLPEPIKRGVGRAARATADALDTPGNRDRLEQARNAAGDAAGRAREAVGEGARNVAERGRERLRKLRERDDAGSLPSASEDVPFGDFDPADTPVGRFSSGRRLDRRVSGSDAGRERIMEGASTTRTRLSSGETPKKDKPKKPSRPRDPDNGPMTGKFIEIFRGVKSYQEMLDRYNEQEVIFFDYETTGFDPKVERPVQIGAVKMKGGKVVARFNIFVNPDRELSEWSQANLVDADGNPLTNDWLSGQPSIAEGHQQLIDFFGPDALLGGQFTPFDLSFLDESLRNAGIEWTPAGVIDSKALADELLPRWTADGGDGPFALNPDGTKYATNSLGPLSEYLEVELTAWHTADADSEASAMIVQKILERAAENADVPKHLLDVDNLPNVLTERKARHKLEMDKYFADMKQYKVDNEAYEASLAGERFSSGETYKEIVREKGRPSEKQREAISDIKEILASEEFKTEDTWTYENGTVDTPERAALKEKVVNRVKDAFSGDIKSRFDITVTANNGEKINLGRDFEIVVESAEVRVSRYDEGTVKEIKEAELYDAFTGVDSDSPSSVVSITISIKPKDKEALERLQKAGIPSSMFSDEIYNNPEVGDVYIGTSSIDIITNGDDAHVTLQTLYMGEESQGKGIGSIFSARNEGIYEEMGVSRIVLQGQSTPGYMHGGTHWPKNGFTWAGEGSKQDFIKVIDEAIRKTDSKLSKEEKEKISSLYSKNPLTGKFETDASAEQLIDFESADEVFQEADEGFLFKRDIETALAGGSRFSSGESSGRKEKADSSNRFSSGAKYQAIVDAQPPLSEDKKQSISEFREELTGEEFQKEDIYVLDTGPTPPRPPGMPEPKPRQTLKDDEKRTLEKKRVRDLFAEIFNGEMMMDEDVIITADDGTQLNIGKKVLIEVGPQFPYTSAIKIKKVSEKDLSEQDEMELYERWIEEGDVLTEMSLSIRIKPLPEYNDKLVAMFSEDDARRYVSQEDGTPSIATANRTFIQISRDGKETRTMSHDGFYVNSRAQGQGIGSVFNARNEKIYNELDVNSVMTWGSSGGDSTGAVHWPKNGFTWAGEGSKQEFIKLIDDALSKTPELFSEKDRKKISSLYSKNKNTGLFETEATAEEFLDFPEADKVFSDANAQFMYTRPLRQPVGASSGGSRFSSGEGKRSPGLKANRDRPMSEYGMDWKPEYSDKEWVAPAKTWEGWDDVPVTEVDLSSEILPTESHLKGSSIDKVVSGEEAFREGYHPNLIIDTDGKMYVSDGHNRVAMHRALGNEKMTARVIDLRKQGAPWGDKTPNMAETRLSSGEGPRANKPKRAKMYRGYTLNEPDNPTPKPGEYPDDVVEAATKQRAKIAEVEAEITKLLIDLADKNKAQMEGLDYRMKALKSLMRKIAAEKDSEHGGDAQKAAEAMSDVVRYTMSYEPDDYVAGVKDVIAQMQKLGYDLRVKNYWQADDPYQGINVAVTHPNGTKFELQFHTPQSVADKEKIHAIYEDYRTETNYLKRLVMYRKMVNLANKIGIPIPPDELMKIGIVKTQPFTRS